MRNLVSVYVHSPDTGEGVVYTGKGRRLKPIVSPVTVRRRKPTARGALRFDEDIPVVPHSSPGHRQRRLKQNRNQRKLQSQPAIDQGSNNTGHRLVNVPSMPSIVSNDTFRRATVVYEKLAFSKPLQGDPLAPYFPAKYKKLKPLPAIEKTGKKGPNRIIRRLQNPGEALSTASYGRRGLDDDGAWVRGQRQGLHSGTGSDLSSSHGYRPMWKDSCDCMRCGIIKQSWTDNDADSYKNWGEYPCVKLPAIDPTQPLSDDED